MIPYEADEVTRLIVDDHDAAAFAEISHLTVGEFRNWLLSPAADGAALERIAPGLTPEMVAAVSKLMRNQDLIAAARKRRVVTRFRNTVGLPGRMSVRLQPNHPTDDVKGIAASMLDGLMYGCGDAMIGINPATDSLAAIVKLLAMIDGFRERYGVPTQSCVLTHVTNTIAAVEKARRSISCSSRSRAPRRRTRASGSRLHCSARRARPRCRSSAARSATT